MVQRCWECMHLRCYLAMSYIPRSEEPGLRKKEQGSNVGKKKNVSLQFMIKSSSADTNLICCSKINLEGVKII